MEQQYIVIWEYPDNSQYELNAMPLDEALAAFTTQVNQFIAEGKAINWIQIQKEGY